MLSSTFPFCAELLFAYVRLTTWLTLELFAAALYLKASNSGNTSSLLRSTGTVLLD